MRMSWKIQSYMWPAKKVNPNIALACSKYGPSMEKIRYSMELPGPIFLKFENYRALDSLIEI